MEFRSVETIVRALNEAGVEYLVVGGLAVNAHGFERLTKDVDIVVSLAPQNIIMALKTLEAIGYHMSIPVSMEEFADAGNRDAWRREKNMIVLKMWSDAHRRTPIDIFIYEPFVFSDEYVKAEWFDISESLRMPVVRLEALIEMKRHAGRLQDLADIDDLLTIQRIRNEEQNTSAP